MKLKLVIKSDKNRDKKSEKVRTMSRNEILETYKVSGIKEEIKSDYSYRMTQEMYSSFYAGIDPRRRPEMADGSMVKEDRNAMANCPIKGYQKEYPRAGYYANPYIQDSVEEKD